MIGLIPRFLEDYDRRLARAKALSLVFIFVFGGLILRLYYLQCIENDRFRDLSECQHFATLRVPSKRGMIRDMNGNLLAVSVEHDSVFVDPGLMEDGDVDRVAAFLGRVLEIDADGLRGRIRDAMRPEKRGRFIWVARKIEDAKARRIAMAKLPGVAFTPEYKRIYTRGVSGCHLLGFVGVDNDGLSNLEYLYDRTLSGTDGIRRRERDGRGNFLSCEEEVAAPPVAGFDVELTIDSFIQETVETTLAKVMEEFAPVSATAVAMDVRTGAVLAIGNRPNFDPNELGTSQEDSRRNRAVTDCYEPGSVMKPFTVSAAIEKGLVTPKTKFHCGNGQGTFGRRILKDHHLYGTLDVTGIIRLSSNVGAAKIGVKCGPKLLHDTLQGFGFGRPTGVDLPGEAPGMLADPSRWTSYSPPSIAIGQEMAVTPLQLATGFSALANEGVVMRPYVVSRVLDSKGNVVRQARPRSVGRAVSAETARDKVVPMLAEVVARGTGRRAKSRLYTLAGKTGTAQKPLEDGRGYSHSKFISAFAGFGPVEDPRVCVVVMVNETAPGKPYYGGRVAAPAAGEILEKTLQYLMVPTSASLKVADAASRH